MSDHQRQTIIDELATSFEAVMVPARLGQEVPQDSVRRLLRAVEEFGREWAGRSDIPKAAARWFADSRLLHGWAQKYPEGARRDLEAGASALCDAIARAINAASEAPRSR